MELTSELVWFVIKMGVAFVIILGSARFFRKLFWPKSKAYNRWAQLVFIALLAGMVGLVGLMVWQALNG